MKSPIALAFIAGTIIFTVAGQLLLKWAMLGIGAVPQERSLLVGFVIRVFTDLRVISGFACAFIASFFWILAVSRSTISFAYPFMGLAIVFVLSLAPALFHEAVPWTRWFGVLVVCAGIWIAAQQ